MSVRSSLSRAAVNYGWGKINRHPEYTFDPPYGYPPTANYKPRNCTMEGGATCGGAHRPLTKGSAEMKAYMSYIRSLRGRKRGRRTAYKKSGSLAAKRYMAYVRSYLCHK